MKTYCIKFRIAKPRFYRILGVSQVLPDYEHCTIESLRVKYYEFGSAYDYACKWLSEYEQYIGVRAQIVSIEEV